MNIIKKHLLFLSFLFFYKEIISNFQDLPAPYNSLKILLPYDDHGFYLNADWIKMLFKNNNIKNGIEIGSWLGKSTRHIASLLPSNGTLYAVDTWKGSAEHQPEINVFNTACKLPTLYEQFLSNVIHANLVHKIIPIRMTSLDASQHLSDLKQKIDFIYIDAAHDTESVLQDLEAWYPYILEPKGIICGDDWGCDSVKIAVAIFAQKYSLTIYADHYFWFLKKEDRFKHMSFVNASNTIWKFS
ncbi:class I SAM-dependent methyltransferase [Candidatus Dependentiae bacterium]|nr:class I SAM-dependent methyltransferase [Candidatus Dependentiae bacterium]